MTVVEGPGQQRSRMTKAFSLLPRITATIVMLIGLMVLIGWALELHAITGAPGGEFRMQPMTAVAFIILGLSLMLGGEENPSRRDIVLSIVLALVVAALAITSGAEYVLNRNLGVDLALFHDAVIRAAANPPGRMAMNTTIAFLFGAVGLLLLPHDRKVKGLKSQVAALAVLLIAFVALIGYAFGVRDFYSIQLFIGMSLYSAIAFTIFGIGLLFGQLDRGLSGLVADEGAAGVVARRLLPGTIALPFIFGMLRLAGEQSGLFGGPMATSLFVVADIATFLLLIAWSTRVLRVTDRTRAFLLVREREARAVSERARAEAEAARTEAEAARAEAESANGAKSDFLAVMSHELRTPLSAIMGYQELLSDGISGPINEHQAQQLGRIKASARHLLSLIDEILTFTRIDAGREEVELAETSVTAVLHEAALLIDPIAKEKNLPVEIVPPQPDIVLETDPTKVRQMIVNLLSNAVKFTDQGRITLSAQQRGNDVMISVADTGIGIDQENFQRIFEPFWQVEQKATRRAGGTGLGLTVTKRLAMLLGGDVAVRSRPEEGTTFTISLPTRSATEAPMVARITALRTG
ncbi:MAG TPA: HAMP domain-containing sensor histidine kinase [Gemmatimonadaceae bacterium]|jgi:signal transduction histidine kinase